MTACNKAAVLVSKILHERLIKQGFRQQFFSKSVLSNSGGRVDIEVRTDVTDKDTVK